jgi:excisionase family DNA binding protein
MALPYRDLKMPTNLTIQPGYLPLREAAAWAGVSERTLKRWISRGLPAFQAGPREKVLIRPTDIDAFLTRQQVPQPDLKAMAEEVFQNLQRGQR